MIKNIRCMKNIITKECKRKYIKEIVEEIGVKKRHIEKIDKLQKKLNKCIEREKLSEILKFNIEYIDKYSFEYEDTEYEEKSLCNLKPDVCKIEVNVMISKLEELNNRINDKIDCYNKELLVLDRLKVHHSHKANISKEEYLKFGRDRNNNLIALYFDIDRFVEKKSSTMHLFTGNEELGNSSVLFLLYEDSPQKYSLGRSHRFGECGYALICDFISRDKKLGHGTYMLSNLESIVKKINNRINYINRNIHPDDRINEIVAINGMVCPGSDISYKDLVKFYNKNGYPTFKDDKYIYKEL